ncbi:hypothetical protein PR048_030192 [Dryococelus australis]|uniref:Uncharacterized protein n=1 Tax=Dryococelus australis TaxID=614101 RepID=A0ABQ9G8P4_9NEOP|nr:hypothetical protein PR048_030192 [Dryococelus australis]
MQGKQEIPEKTRRPAASSSTIPTCKNPGSTPPGIETGLRWWEAISLTTTPPRPLLKKSLSDEQQPPHCSSRVHSGKYSKDGSFSLMSSTTCSSGIHTAFLGTKISLMDDILANSFAAAYKQLWDEFRDQLPLYLSSDAILDWFGNVTSGQENIAHYMLLEVPNTTHIFSSVNQSSTTLPQAATSADFSGSDASSLSLDLSALSITNGGNVDVLCTPMESVLCVGVDMAPVKGGKLRSSEFSDVLLMEAVGKLQFTHARNVECSQQKSMKLFKDMQRWERACRLRVFYSVVDTVTVEQAREYRGCPQVTLFPPLMWLASRRWLLSDQHGILAPSLMINQVGIKEPQNNEVVKFGRHLTMSREPMRVKRGEYETALKCTYGGIGDPRENPPTSGIVKHDSHVRKSGNRTRFVLVEGEYRLFTRYAHSCKQLNVLIHPSPDGEFLGSTRWPIRHKARSPGSRATNQRMSTPASKQLPHHFAAKRRTLAFAAYRQSTWQLFKTEKATRQGQPSQHAGLDKVTQNSSWYRSFTGYYAAVRRQQCSSIELDRRVRARQARPKSFARLMEWLQEEWRRIPVDVLQTLVESMPDGVAAVTAARVLYTLCIIPPLGQGTRHGYRFQALPWRTGKINRGSPQFKYSLETARRDRLAVPNLGLIMSNRKGVHSQSDVFERCPDWCSEKDAKPYPTQSYCGTVVVIMEFRVYEYKQSTAANYFPSVVTNFIGRVSLGALVKICAAVTFIKGRFQKRSLCVPSTCSIQFTWRPDCPPQNNRSCYALKQGVKSTPVVNHFIASMCKTAQWGAIVQQCGFKRQPLSFYSTVIIHEACSVQPHVLKFSPPKTCTKNLKCPRIICKTDKGFGATVAELLVCSPHTKPTRVQSPAGLYWKAGAPYLRIRFITGAASGRKLDIGAEHDGEAGGDAHAQRQRERHDYDARRATSVGTLIASRLAVIRWPPYPQRAWRPLPQAPLRCGRPNPASRGLPRTPEMLITWPPRMRYRYRCVRTCRYFGCTREISECLFVRPQPLARDVTFLRSGGATSQVGTSPATSLQGSRIAALRDRPREIVIASWENRKPPRPFLLSTHGPRESGYGRQCSRASQRYDGNIARFARRSEEALGVRVSVARIAPSLHDLGRAAT